MPNARSNLALSMALAASSSCLWNSLMDPLAGWPAGAAPWRDSRSLSSLTCLSTSSSDSAFSSSSSCSSRHCTSIFRFRSWSRIEASGTRCLTGMSRRSSVRKSSRGRRLERLRVICLAWCCFSKDLRRTIDRENVDLTRRSRSLSEW